MLPPTLPFLDLNCRALNVDVESKKDTVGFFNIKPP